MEYCSALKSGRSSSRKWPEVTSDNGLLYTRQRKSHKVMQIKKFTSSCSLSDHSWNCPGHRSHAYLRSRQVSSGCHFRKSKVCHSVVRVVELVGVPRPNSGAGQCWWPEKIAEFLLHMLKNAGSNAELKGLDINSLVIERIQVNKAPKVRPGQNSPSSWADFNPYAGSPCHTEMILLKKSRLFLNQKGRLHRRR